MRRRVNGYTDFGGIQIPPRPQGIVLTDRADGTRWFLSLNLTQDPPADGNGRVSINDSIPTNIPYTEYEAYGEPYIATDPLLRLIVRNGKLGVEIGTDLPGYVTDQDNAPIYARRGNGRKVHRIYKPDTFAVERVLAWEPVDL